MRIYNVKFNKYENDYVNDLKKVSRKLNGKKECIDTDKYGYLLIPEFDLQKYENFGEGYESVKIVGNLNDKYFIPITENEADESVGVISLAV